MSRRRRLTSAAAFGGLLSWAELSAAGAAALSPGCVSSSLGGPAVGRSAVTAARRRWRRDGGRPDWVMWLGWSGVMSTSKPLLTRLISVLICLSRPLDSRRTVKCGPESTGSRAERSPPTRAPCMNRKHYTAEYKPTRQPDKPADIPPARRAAILESARAARNPRKKKVAICLQTCQGQFDVRLNTLHRRGRFLRW